MIFYFTFPVSISTTGPFTFCFVCFIHERGQNVTILYVEVVVGSEHIGGDDCRIPTSVLLEVRPANTNTHTPFPNGYAQNRQRPFGGQSIQLNLL